MRTSGARNVEPTERRKNWRISRDAMAAKTPLTVAQKDMLFMKVHELPLSTRPLNRLNEAGIYYVGELVQRTPRELLDIELMGKKSFREIEGLLRGMGFSELGIRVPDWKIRLRQYHAKRNPE